MNNLEIITLVIPSLNPPIGFPQFVQKLQDLGIVRIIIVNDGSSKEFDPIFDVIENVILIKNEINMGKGNALKKAYQYILSNTNKCQYVLSCDDDGQHSPMDVFKIAKFICDNLLTNSIFLGSRNFDQNVPLKSFIGNRFMKTCLKLLTGTNIKDTQTGLRGIPVTFLKETLELPENGFNFELSSLLYFLKRNYQIIEFPIETIYFEKNRSTRFKWGKDSLKVTAAFVSFFSRK